MFLPLTILLIYGLWSSVYGEPTCPTKNGTRPKYFPHESDCSKFYECSNGKPYLLSCAEDLYFNSKLNVCDWSWNAGCGLHLCPPKDGAFPVYIPHQDCRKFYECSNGVSYLFNCPETLHFNPTLNVCDYPFRTNCSGSKKEEENHDLSD